MTLLGHNNPPSAIEFARRETAILNSFLTLHPTIDADTARDAAQRLETARKTLQDLDAERDNRVRPLNTQVRIINDEYRQPRSILEGCVAALRGRLSAFAQAEEARRRAEAEEARRRAEEAERIAREAEAKEDAAKLDAMFGQQADLATVITEADQAFDDFKRADREAARAEKATAVRLDTGLGRTLGTRSRETLIVDDAAAALASVGLTDGIRDAILTAARAYRKLHGRLPDGIRQEMERVI